MSSLDIKARLHVLALTFWLLCKGYRDPCNLWLREATAMQLGVTSTPGRFACLVLGPERPQKHCCMWRNDKEYIPTPSRDTRGSICSLLYRISHYYLVRLCPGLPILRLVVALGDLCWPVLELAAAVYESALQVG
ncbi:hypothetical protein LY76DRAFT_418302 [Colletotrichum caudatum]|nr:hypothetical protein LY76DRAFT_418302 [Colletotrichum caudatum]